MKGRIEQVDFDQQPSSICNNTLTIETSSFFIFYWTDKAVSFSVYPEPIFTFAVKVREIFLGVLYVAYISMLA